MNEHQHTKYNGHIRMRGMSCKTGYKESRNWIDSTLINRACEKFFASRGLDHNGTKALKQPQ